MRLQGLGDLVDVDGCPVIIGLELGHLLRGLLKQSQEALALLLIGVEFLQIPDHAGEHISHFPEVVGLDVLKNILGEIRHLLLDAAAVLQDRLGIGDIDLFGEIRHLALLLLRKDVGSCQRFLGSLGLGLRLRLFRGRLLAEYQGRSRSALQIFRKALRCSLHLARHILIHLQNPSSVIVCAWACAPSAVSAADTACAACSCLIASRSSGVSPSCFIRVFMTEMSLETSIAFSL